MSRRTKDVPVSLFFFFCSVEFCGLEFWGSAFWASELRREFGGLSFWVWVLGFRVRGLGLNLLNP